MNENKELEGTAVEDVVTPAPPQQIALNAQVVDEAFRKLEQALSDKLRVDMAVATAQGLTAKDRDELHRKAKVAEAVVTIARTEVDRVMALMNYFQLEIYYKSAQPPAQPVQ